MKLESYKEQYKPLAILQSGSKMLNLDNENSDTDLIFYLGNNELPPEIIDDKELRTQIFFLNDKLEFSPYSKNERFKIAELVGKIQIGMIKPENIIYNTDKNITDALIAKCKENKEKFLYELIDEAIEWISLDTCTLCTKLNYHLCYLACLLDNSEPDWEAIKRIKRFELTPADKQYLIKQKQKLKAFWNHVNNDKMS